MVLGILAAGGVSILKSTWLLDSTDPALAVFNGYRRLIDDNDRLFVCHVDDRWAFWLVMNPVAAKRALP